MNLLHWLRDRLRWRVVVPEHADDVLHQQRFAVAEQETAKTAARLEREQRRQRLRAQRNAMTGEREQEP